MISLPSIPPHPIKVLALVHLLGIKPLRYRSLGVSQDPNVNTAQSMSSGDCNAGSEVIKMGEEAEKRHWAGGVEKGQKESPMRHLGS